MEISDFLGIYPNVDDEEFQFKIASKQEFNELTLGRHESLKIGANFKHQTIIERFLSDKTDFNAILLFHELGAGKTRTSILVAEINKKAELSKRAMVFTKGELLQRNFKQELYYADEMYRPKDDRGRYIDQRRDRIRYLNNLTRLTEKYYQFFTFEKFARKSKKYSDSQIKSLYSNRVIIIDEAHNLRIQKNKQETQAQYDALHRLLHTAENCKIILMSGTPIWDSPEEIASLMNLILPLDQQMDYETFTKKFFKNEKLVNKKELQKIFQGRVSYVRRMEADVKKQYQGEKTYSKHLPLYHDEMSKFQWDVLQKSKKDTTDKGQAGGSFRQFEREAANFVFPDGSYGKKGFDKYCHEPSKGVWRFKTKDIENDIKTNLKKYSSKFYSTIQEILKNPKEKVFVSHQFVKGSGAILFAIVLELFGFEKTKKADTEKRRYAIVTSETAGAASEAKRIIDQFNDPKNKNGDFVQVLIGSRKMSEGITLKDVIQTHIITSHWNTSSTDQAVGRTVRYGSHDNIGKNVTVRIYLHAATYKQQTIDIDLYQMAEEKDYKSRQVYRLMKESAIDCPLTYKRNVLPSDKNHSRECDYAECNYECVQMTKPITELDRVTYNLYYSQKTVERIVKTIEYLFKFFNHIAFSQLVQFVKEDELLILKSLEYIIDSKMIIRDKFGFPNFLKESHNTYFLDSSISQVKHNPYYNEHPIIRNKTKLSDIIDILRINADSERIDYICKVDDVSEVEQQMEELDQKTRVITIEAAFDLLQQNKNNKKAKAIVDKYQHFLYKLDNEDVIKFHFQTLSANLAKQRLVQSYVDNIEFIVNYFYPSDKIDKLKKLISDPKNNRQKILKLLESLQKKILANTKIKQTVVHVMLASEEETTSYKRVLKETGLTRCYDLIPGSEWKFCDPTREGQYIGMIREFNDATKRMDMKENTYGIWGTVDKAGSFRVVVPGSRGFICKNSSNKLKLIKIIFDLREKEIQDEKETTFDIPISNLTKNMSREQLRMALESNAQKGLDDVFGSIIENGTKDEMRILDGLLSVNIKHLCHLIQTWLESKNLIQRV